MPVAGSIFTLRADQIDEHWETILRFLVMIEDPDWLYDTIRTYLKDGRAQLWGLADKTEIKGIWITRIDERASTPFGLVWIAAGKGLEAGVPLFLECTEKWFREKGCEYIEINGRKGWEKIIPGFRFHSVCLRKSLE